MKYLERRAAIAAQFISNYNFQEPFHLYLSKQFRADKKFGSKDRKALRELCYSYFRYGFAYRSNELAEQIGESWKLMEEWKEKDQLKEISDSDHFNLDSFEKHKEKVSERVGTDNFFNSLLKQPLLWIWLRQKQNDLIKDLDAREIEYKVEGEESVGLPNGFSLDSLPGWIKKFVEVQDLSSQQICSKIELEDGADIWDCCAGSGGKSLRLNKTYGNLKIFASDVRPQILNNLKRRFSNNSIEDYKVGLIDLTKDSKPFNFSSVSGVSETRTDFKYILCDVPCSGSGTWGRTPEVGFHWKDEDLKTYTERQAKILEKAFDSLSEEGALYYVTCSVFEEENEGVIQNFLKQETNCQLEWDHYEIGVEHNADTLYCAKLSRIAL